MKHRIIPIIVILVLAVGGYYLWTYYQAQVNKGKLTASGTIEAIEVQVGSKVSGRVLERYVDEGSVVAKGDPIAKIDVPELKAQLDQAKAAAGAAASRAKNSADDFERISMLYEDKMASRQQYEAAEMLADSSRDMLKQAKAAVSQVQVQVDNADIISPVSGTVLVKAVEPGELVSQGSTIVTIADLKELEIKIYVSEREYGKIKLGDEVEISVDSFPGEKFIGRVKRISDKAEFTPKSIQTKDERVNQMFEIKVSIPNPDQKLKPGMPADAIIKILNPKS